MAKFTKIGYVSETKKSQKGESEKTFMLTIAPFDKTVKAVQLSKGAKILLSSPKKGKNQSEEDFAKVADWKLFDAVLIEDDDEQTQGDNF